MRSECAYRHSNGADDAGYERDPTNQGWLPSVQLSRAVFLSGFSEPFYGGLQVLAIGEVLHHSARSAVKRRALSTSRSIGNGLRK